MISENSKRTEFKEEVSPHLEVLLRISLWLTRNGDDATRLMHRTLAEAYRLWDGRTSEADCLTWLRKILTKQFLIDVQQHSHMLGADRADKVEEREVEDVRFSPESRAVSRRSSSAAGRFDEDVIYFRAIAGLPAVVRPAMILSCLEGFTSGEIATLAGAQTYAVESLLKRGRTLLQNELFAHLIGDNGSDKAAQGARVQE